MKTYEITYLTAGEESADAKTIAPVLQSHGAKIVSVFPWEGRRKLTYPIKKQDQAFYTTVVFETEPTALVEIDRDLRHNDAVLRSIIVIFEPGMFHRSPEVVRPPRETKEETVVEAVETPTETPAEEPKEEEKPKRKRTPRATTPEDKQELDKKLDELLNKDLTD